VADGATVFLSSHILSEVEKTCDRVAIIREGRWSGSDTVDGLRDLAHHEVELRFAGDVPADAFAGLPGVSRRHRSTDHVAADAGRRVDHPGRPGRRRYELLDFVSREPSLEETFLAQYGRRPSRWPVHDR
jgi:ABC-2 type transport system ATP-binding protein